MRYLGSKTLLLDFIGKITSEYSSGGKFCDPFGGIGTVGSYMKSQGYTVISGDILHFAYFFQKAKIESNILPQFPKLKQLLGIKDICDIEQFLSFQVKQNGWFIKEYSKNRQFFTLDNAKHIQACVDYIWRWKAENIITKNEYAVLIASLIQSMDKVANTAGTYYAYLKSWYRKAKKPFVFQFQYPIEGKFPGKAFLMDANKLVKNVEADILYLDPPYNERNYGSYYHLPETIARGNIPVPRGKSGVYTYMDTKSEYNKKTEIERAFSDLVNHTSAKCIIFHYTDDGLLDEKTVRGILNSIGKTDEYYFDSKGYSTIPGVVKCQHHIYRVIK